jgi:hypothetical protein
MHGRKKRNAYKILVRKLEGKRLLGRPMRRREDNIRRDLREIRWESVWTAFIWLRNGITGRLLLGYIKDGEFLD